MVESNLLNAFVAKNVGVLNGETRLKQKLADPLIADLKLIAVEYITGFEEDSGLITKARKGDFNSIRQISKSLKSKEIVHKLVHEISPNFTNRNGGYTRIIKLGYRNNDRASVSYIEFVETDGSKS